MERMRAALKTSIDHERAIADDNSGIRAALDRIGAGAVVADLDHKIIYANDFAQGIFRTHATEIRKVAPQFDAERIVGASFSLFAGVTALQSRHFTALTGTYTADVVMGAATLRVIANPVIDGNQKRLGTVMQWLDRTAEVAAEDEVKGTVAQAIEGDLTARLTEDGKEGFFKALATGMNRLIANMGDVVAAMTKAADEVRSGAEEISRGNLNLSRRTEDQASSLEQTAASMEQMTSIVKNNAESAVQADRLAVAAREHAQKGGQVVGSAVAAMSEINASSSKIAAIIGVIDEIAFQTNLLALNAAVEAARAGEQGRGFAVVASEVRNLASRSAAAAKEIKTLIQDSVGKVTEGARLVDETGTVLGEIVVGVTRLTEVVTEIAVASREQASGIEQVNKAVTSMESVTQQNAALVEEAAAAAQTLTEQASGLTELIAGYRVGAPTLAAPRQPQPHTAARSRAA